MEAGRELDAKMAVDVLDWSWASGPGAHGGDHWYGEPPGIADPQELPLLSTSWDAMQQVVEAMRERGYVWQIEDIKGHRWHAILMHRERTIGIFQCAGHAYSETLPHAVCLAALRACEAES